MARGRWFALDVNVFDNDLTVDLRDEFGPVGLCMWVGFLAACKRNAVEGRIRYSSDAECLSLMGLPAVELVDEWGEPFKLDDFWTFLGRHKQTKVTRSKRLVDVVATRWEEWQKSAKRDEEAERKRRSRAESGRTEPGRTEDASRTDIDIDKDKDKDKDGGQAAEDLFDQFWTEYPRKVAKPEAKKAWTKVVKSNDPDEIINGAIRYAENLRDHKTETKFYAHPATWLRAERWNDELVEPTPTEAPVY